MLTRQSKACISKPRRSSRLYAELVLQTLHVLVAGAIQILGGETRQEIRRDCMQKRAKPVFEPELYQVKIIDEGSGEGVQLDFSDSVQNDGGC